MHVTDGRAGGGGGRSAASFDVVLMDAQMPVHRRGRRHRGHPGRCRSRSRGSSRVTASVLTSDRTAFLAAGADDFLTKPVRLATLDDALGASPTPAAARAAGGRPRPRPRVVPVPGGPTSGPGWSTCSTPRRSRSCGTWATTAFAHLYEHLRRQPAATVAAICWPPPTAAPWSEDDDGSVPRLAHRLKGSSAAHGRHRLADLCRQLRGAPGATAEPCCDALVELEEESRRVQAAVATLLDAGR